MWATKVRNPSSCRSCRSLGTTLWVGLTIDMALLPELGQRFTIQSSRATLAGSGHRLTLQGELGQHSRQEAEDTLLLARIRLLTSTATICSETQLVPATPLPEGGCGTTAPGGPGLGGCPKLSGTGGPWLKL